MSNECSTENCDPSSSTFAAVFANSLLSFPYKESFDVWSECESMIGEKRKLSRQYIKDFPKKGRAGAVIRWKNGNVIEGECDKGDVFGVLVISHRS